MKGYVVRGKAEGDSETLRAFRYHHVSPPFTFRPERGDPDRYARMGTDTFATLPDAMDAYRAMGHLRDVRIFAVAADGTETPLPTYAEALSMLAELRAWADLEAKATEALDGTDRDPYCHGKSATLHGVVEFIDNPDALRAYMARPGTLVDGYRRRQEGKSQ